MKRLFILLTALLLVSTSADAGIFTSKKKKSETAKKEAAAKKDTSKKESAYNKLFKEETAVAKSEFLTIHNVKNKVYVELPMKYLEREMLLASTVVSASKSDVATVGYKNNEPLHIKFILRDSTVYMCEVNSDVDFNKADDAMAKAVSNTYADTWLYKYKIEAMSADSSAMVLDMTKIFTGDSELALKPMIEGVGFVTIISNFKNDLSHVNAVRAFQDNASVEVALSYDCSANILGIIKIPIGAATTTVNRSILLLTESKMKPRLADARVGVFNTTKYKIDNKQDKIDYTIYANRWRLEPSDSAAWEAGKLVEPIKPIVFYIDDAFPADWNAPLKEGILRWNVAFEKIGFKNAIQVRDFPKDDPEFDPNNLKYSCVRYLPVQVANAMGPSWVDPQTGEIINASVIVYGDIVKLINNWRFTQTAQIDPRVRNKKMPADVMAESIAYVIAHEVGHTLGYMHNMSASSSYKVDSLRSVSFTQKYGTTPSIMDYARFNYVAQPSDKGVALTPPDLGEYDLYSVKWLYSPIKGNLSAEQEAKIVESWVDQKVGDSIYRFGKQQIYSRYDPSSIEEDLGDNPVKAGEYGISNLKYILSNLDGWIKDDPTCEHRKELYQSIVNQYFLYLRNASYNIGGIYLYQVKEGTEGKRFIPVDKKTQKESMQWIVRELRQSDWIDAKELTAKFGLGVDLSLKLKSSVISSLLRLGNNVTLSSYISDNPYRVADYYNDLYTTVWEPTAAGKKLTAGDKLMQNIVMTNCISSIKQSLGIRSVQDNPMLPTVDDIIAYRLDESGIASKYANELREIDAQQGSGTVAKAMMDNQKQFGSYGDFAYQSQVDISTINESMAYYYSMLKKAETLIKSKIATASSEDKPHYQAMLLMIKKFEN